MPFEIKGGAIVNATLTCDNCPANGDCHFDRKRDGVGGFKGPGQRARNVSYRLITDQADGRRASENFVSCRQFTENLDHRMRYGKQLREEGKDGEIITLTGVEGQTIRCRTQVKINSRGQIIQPQAEIVQALRDSGHEVNETDMSYPVAWKDVSYDFKVPKLAEIRTGSRYDQEIIERQLKHDQIEQRTSEQVWEEAQKRMDAESAPVPAIGREPEKPDKAPRNPWGRAGKPKDAGD